MAVRPGEENVATLFGDVHYFYGPETARPLHHRFDKGSYVYLFENAAERRARIEIANLVGTDDQDAFDGSLDKVHVTYSYRHHCMVSLSVGAVEGHDEWHLPTFDPRNENKYHYKLRSLDIYFWTHDDALTFVNGVRRVLPSPQVDVQDEPAPPPQHQHQHLRHQEINPIVSRLEDVAIADSTLVLPPPPPPPPPGPEAAADHSAPSSASPASFAPIPYNPAAPAAPEQIRHREKTPPPDDGDSTDDNNINSNSQHHRPLHPLHQCLAIDAGTPFSPGLLQHHAAAGAFGPGPLSPGVPPPQFANPPGAPSFPGPPGGTPGFAPPPPQQQQLGFGVVGGGAAAAAPGAPSLPPPHPALLQRATMMPVAGQGLASPALQSLYGGGGVYHPQQQVTSPLTSPGLASPYASGGYHYTTQQQGGGGGHGVAGNNEYAIHQQAYRPAEGEMPVKFGPKKEVRGRLEENAGRVERGVTGMLKKFERKFG